VNKNVNKEIRRIFECCRGQIACNISRGVKFKFTGTNCTGAGSGNEKSCSAPKLWVIYFRTTIQYRPLCVDDNFTLRFVPLEHNRIINSQVLLSTFKISKSFVYSYTSQLSV
jgi:hypothetical protein